MIEVFGAAVVAFVAMEPLTYAAHRWIMHGIGWTLHRSHHQRRSIDGWADRFEANDWFPVLFAAATIFVMAVGSGFRSLHLLVPLGVGVTAYGVAYSAVHDVYIHGRLGRLPTFTWLERLRDAHAIHHLYGGEPYGMLCPVVPKALRARAATTVRDPFLKAEAASRSR